VRPGVTTTYHTFSRTVNGQYLFGTQERDHLRRLVYKLAEFLCVTIHTYTALSNHFHLVLKVPGQVRRTDSQLLQALRRFYGPKHRQAVDFAQALRTGSPRLAQLRHSHLARMGDLSNYMKELKQAMAKWFNAKWDRFGPLWAERFGSVLTSQAPWMILLFCAYVDLNSVRGGLTPDPKDYPWCGYSEALARAGPCREGLSCLLPGKDWKEKLAHYRMLLFGKGSWGKNDQVRRFDPVKVLEVFQAKGQLPPEELLRLTVKHFTQAGALGDKESLQAVLEHFEKKRGKGRRKAGWPLLEVGGKVLMSLRKVKEGIRLPKQFPKEPEP